MSKSNISRRVIFPKGGQKLFLIRAKQKLKTSSRELATLLDITIRTVTDWIGEKHSMSETRFNFLLKKTKIKIPKGVEIKDPYWYTSKGGKAGGAAHYKKYGYVGVEPSKRKEAWKRWWKEEGQFKEIKILQRSEIAIPPKSVELAEFVGIMLGDGCITKDKISISLNSKEKSYAKFISKMVENLFSVTPKILIPENISSLEIIVQRKNLVDFCQSIGLVVGDKIKQNIDIPQWIKKSKTFSIACVRGLFDTDGCAFKHCYTVNGKKYTYNKLAFTSRSPLLLASTARILINLGFNVRMTKDGNDVRIESQKYVEKYGLFIGSNNPRYI